MVRQMQDKLNLPVLGIVDYNVHGLGILLTYKLGSVRLGLESFRYGMNLGRDKEVEYSLPFLATDVKWLALRGKSLEALDLPEKSFQELTPRDHAKIDSLLASPIVKVSSLPSSIVYVRKILIYNYLAKRGIRRGTEADEANEQES